MDKTHYEILGVAPDAPQKSIKSAYHQLLLQTHPDKSHVQPQISASSSDSASTASVAALQEAYSILSDPQKRKEYDDEIADASKKNGFNISGAGLDFYTLSDFEECTVEGSDTYEWTKDCPRCTSRDAIVLTEADLERGTPDGAGGYQIVAGCQACSLWITVAYEEAEEEDV